MSDCIIWTGSKTKSGYGNLGRGGRTFYAHRVAYEEAYGPIPDGLVIDHLCRNRLCVNPEHLEAVPHRTNVLRGVSRPAQQAQRSECPAGHPYDEANTYWWRGHRRCRKCNAEAARRSRAS